jgi:4-hydroxy-tetrahydrodipicolinate reductase
MTTVLINGAFGNMGQTSVAAINAHPSLTLVAQLGRQDNLAEALKHYQPKMAIDFTLPECVFSNAQTIIRHQVHPIIGTSGLNTTEIEQLQKLAQKHDLGGIIAPNFSIAANLMMHLSKLAAPFFEYAEIVERHHQNKVDAPAATAIKTAKMISEAQKNPQKPMLDSPYAVNGIPIHVQRLLGCIAEQEVCFSGPEERLTLNYYCQARTSFMSGLLFACDQVTQLNHLVYGLDQLLIKQYQPA